MSRFYVTFVTDICLEIDKIYYAESRWHVKHSVKQSPKVLALYGVGLISCEPHTLVSALFTERAEPECRESTTLNLNTISPQHNYCSPAGI